MMSIERLRLQLPAGYAHRAANITRLLGKYLATGSAGERLQLDRLSIGAITIGPNATDGEIARNIASKVSEKTRGGL